MKISPLHSWNVTPGEAVALQRELAGLVDSQSSLTRCELIAGADISYNKFSSTIYAGVVVFCLSDETVVERQGMIGEATFPYVPGLLSFREVPILLEVFARLKTDPDLIIMDGQGYAHPRRFGLACHAGLWLNRPCLGCAKSRLIGEHREPGHRAGSAVRLLDAGEVIGKVVRTRDGVNPVYVSVGHKIDLESAVRLVLRACRGYRLPEPTRLAHQFVNEMRLGKSVLAVRRQ